MAGTLDIHEPKVAADRTSSSRGRSRIPSLDGLRAFSILFVLIDHGLQTLHPTGPLAFLERSGQFGVRVFFVISGFLITGLLLKETRAEGRVHLGRFYARRFLRLMPAFLVYLLAVLLAWSMHLVQNSWHDVAFAATYTMNYAKEPTWILSHFWSLSVEEQFYLLWPFAMSALIASKSRKVIFSVLVISPIIRWVLYPYHEQLGIVYGSMFPTIADALATGCLLTLYRERLHQSERYIKMLRSGMHWVFLLVALAFDLVILHPPYSLVFGQTLVNLALAMMIDGVVTFPDNLTGRILNIPAITYVGLISYSLYIWQQPFLNPYENHRWTHMPLSLLFIAVFAVGSYHFVEQPALRMRKRLGL